jgi:hypothetical protein
MPEPAASLGVSEKLLSTLRALPTWLFLGSAVACAVVLFTPDFASIHFADFRKQWGLYIFSIGTLALFLGLFRIGDAALKTLVRSRSETKAKQLLKFWLGPSQTNIWSATQQPDGRFVSQISFPLTVLNASDNSVSLVRVEIVKPKFSDVIHSSIFFPNHDYRSADYHTLDPRERDTAQIHITGNGRLSQSEKPVSLSIAVFDDEGTRYLIKKLICNPIPKPPATQSHKG